MIETPFAGGRWTEARYKTFVRSLMRSGSIKWPVMADVKKAARRKSQRDDKRTRFEYQCNTCRLWHRSTEVQVDHLVNLGSITDLDTFAARLFCESDGLQLVCKGCHHVKTNLDRKANHRAKMLAAKQNRKGNHNG